MHQASIPLTFWMYIFATVVYLINRMPKVGLSLGSSFEKLFNKAPDPSKLCVFGCSCFPWLHPYSSHKLDPKSSPCVFLGYSLTPSAFLCFDSTLKKKKKFVYHHVKFVENVFPFVSLSTSTTPVIDTASTLPPSSFPSCDYSIRAPPPPPPYSLLPIPPSSPELLPSSPTPHMSSCRAASPLLIPPSSPKLLPSSTPPHPSSNRATSPLPISSSSPELLSSIPTPTYPPADLHP